MLKESTIESTNDDSKSESSIIDVDLEVSGVDTKSLKRTVSESDLQKKIKRFECFLSSGKILGDHEINTSSGSCSESGSGSSNLSNQSSVNSLEEIQVKVKGPLTTTSGPSNLRRTQSDKRKFTHSSPGLNRKSLPNLLKPPPQKAPISLDELRKRSFSNLHLGSLDNFRQKRDHGFDTHKTLPVPGSNLPNFNPIFRPTRSKSYTNLKYSQNNHNNNHTTGISSTHNSSSVKSESANNDITSSTHTSGTSRSKSKTKTYILDTSSQGNNKLRSKSLEELNNPLLLEGEEDLLQVHLVDISSESSSEELGVLSDIIEEPSVVEQSQSVSSFRDKSRSFSFSQSKDKTGTTGNSQKSRTRVSSKPSFSPLPDEKIQIQIEKPKSMSSVNNNRTDSPVTPRLDNVNLSDESLQSFNEDIDTEEDIIGPVSGFASSHDDLDEERTRQGRLSLREWVTIKFDVFLCNPRGLKKAKEII